MLRHVPLLFLLAMPSLAYADSLDDFAVGLAYTNVFPEPDDGVSLVVDYNIFAFIWVGAMGAWNRFGDGRDFADEVWAAGTLRCVFPGTEIADFQVFAGVGGNGSGLNMRIEAGPKWNLGYVDISLAIGYLSIDSAFDSYDPNWRGFGATIGVWYPGQ